jgi:hypothetical protein
MHIGNGTKAKVLSIDTLPLHLPSGLVLNLNNYYLVFVFITNNISILFIVRWLLI